MASLAINRSTVLKAYRDLERIFVGLAAALTAVAVSLLRRRDA